MGLMPDQIGMYVGPFCQWIFAVRNDRGSGSGEHCRASSDPRNLLSCCEHIPLSGMFIAPPRYSPRAVAQRDGNKAVAPGFCPRAS
jgi:hypothetical protein